MSHLPPDAKKIFSGIIFDVYQWEQEMFDGSKKTFEMLKRPNTLSVIATVGDKILMNKETQPGLPEEFNLPGGRQDPGETPLEGAKRELLEETGYSSDQWALYRSWEPITKVEWEVCLFIARDCKKMQEPLADPGEKIQLLELSFDEFIDVILSDTFHGHELVETVLRMKLHDKKLSKWRRFILNS